MEHAQQVRQVRRIFDYIDNGTTTLNDGMTFNDVSAYTCPDRLAREKAELFRKNALLVGLSCQINRPGDFLTDDYTGLPILVSRDERGQLHGFMNVCRHRGARVAEGCGGGKRLFTCPYHAWSYGLDGAIRSIPDRYGFEGLDEASHGLRRLPVEERDGLVWVLPTPDASLDIETQLGGLAPELKSYGFQNYHHYRTTTQTRKMNWKLVIDTFHETYHIQFLHKKTIDPIFLAPLAPFDAFGQNHRMMAVRRSIETLRGRPESEWDLITYTALVYLLFPNTVFIMQADHLEIFRVFPSGDNPDEATMAISLYTPEAVESDKAKLHWDKNWDLLLAVVNDEDFLIGEGIQRGFHSGAQEHVTYGRFEPALNHYHSQVRDPLGAAA